MNEFTAKKLAEVQAFINLSNVISKQAGDSLKQAMPKVSAGLDGIDANLGEFIKDPTLQTVFETKVGKTVQKVTAMMDLYIGDEWDNPVEIAEWLSFYSGSASAHSALAAAALGALGMAEGQSQVETISENFWKLLQAVKDELANIGAKRAVV